MNTPKKSHLKSRILLTLGLVLGLLILSVYLGIKSQQKAGSNETVVNQMVEDQPEHIKVDLNGDGDYETTRLFYVGSEDEPSAVESFVAYDKNGQEIARLPEGMPISVPSPNSAKIYTPVKKDKNQFVSFDFMEGPHSSRTMFFGLFELKTGEMGILPVCHTLDVKSAYDCLFWSGQAGSLIVDDFDNDGVIEVVEIVDEYPNEGSISADVEQMMNKELDGLEQGEIESMIRIAKREQGGRGNRVVWGIYHYNGIIFEEKLGVDYEKYYKLVGMYLKNSDPDYPTVMRKSDMSSDSLEYNEFMQGFWN